MGRRARPLASSAASLVVVTAAAVFPAASAQTWAQSAPMAAEAASDLRGDWRRHEVVRTYRDDEGCRLSIIAYHHANGGVDTRERRDCGRF
ncbi:hypothetical protein [Rhodoblastus acidophilus]|uniref:hypothetical protein n=1 Tax=Rhodoblastus acidophilus TaxID=1074 RepID=UPI000B4FF604|nr:hypothetical protein [Rhodoblastus acidophilus]PPQ38739.1 hypothetical protein CKO16_08995 [Rhodoblastus acidophilus]RAI20793.1 hypothetical protein CH337_09210 [Rhodoblastus acidophilus]